jgi:zinc protease
MKYASMIKQKVLSKGGTALFAAFPAHGDISITGSLAGGAHVAQAFVCKGDDTCTLSGDVLADMHAAMLLEGTIEHTKADIQIILDTIGASLTFSADKDRLVFQARVRAIHADTLLALIAECLRDAVFPATELRHLKARMLADLSLEAQNPRAQASISLSRILFPYGHPNRHEDTAHSKTAVEAMTRTELRQYHARNIDRRSLVISIAGDMAQDRVFTLVEKHFSTLPAADLFIPPYTHAASTQSQKAVTTIADKASIDYMLGIALGITDDHPDYPALVLGLQILGNRGGFTGRLMKTVREEEGLTYGVYAYPSGFGYGTDGYAAIWGTFAPELFVRGRAAIMREVQKLLDEGPTAREVKRHREMYEARSRVSLASSSMELSHTAHEIVVEGKQPSYLDEFPQRILRLTRAHVHSVLKKYLVIPNFSESAAGPITEIM